MMMRWGLIIATLAAAVGALVAYVVNSIDASWTTLETDGADEISYWRGRR